MNYVSAKALAIVSGFSMLAYWCQTQVKSGYLQRSRNLEISTVSVPLNKTSRSPKSRDGEKKETNSTNRSKKEISVSEIQLDPAGSLSRLIALKDYEVPSIWYSNISLFLIVDGIPIDIRNKAYEALPNDVRLQYAASMFKWILSELQEQDWLSFYARLPFDSNAAKKVSGMLWGHLMASCNLNESLALLKSLPDEYNNGLDIVIRTKLQSLSGFSEIADFLKRLPQSSITGETITNLAGCERIQMNYDDVNQLYAQLAPTNQKGKTLDVLAERGMLSHSDFIHIISTSKEELIDKESIIYHFFRTKADVSPEEFREAMEAASDYASASSCIDMVMGKIFDKGESCIRKFGSEIDNPQFRKYFYGRASYCWTSSVDKSSSSPDQTNPFAESSK